MGRFIPYTPQEMIVRNQLRGTGASFCMCRDYILIYRNDYTYGRHVNDMNAFLGGR